MTVLSTDTWTTTQRRLQITLTEPASRPAPRYFSDVFTDLESLVYVGGIAGAAEPVSLKPDPESPAAARPEYQVDFVSGWFSGLSEPVRIPLRTRENYAEAAGWMFEVARVRYQSPVEILLQAAQGAGSIAVYASAAFLTVKGVLTLWRETLDLRKKHFDTKLAVDDTKMALDLNNRLRAKFELLVEAEPETNRYDQSAEKIASWVPEQRALVDKQFAERLAGAARLLASTTEIAVVEP